MDVLNSISLAWHGDNQPAKHSFAGKQIKFLPFLAQNHGQHLMIRRNDGRTTPKPLASIEGTPCSYISCSKRDRDPQETYPRWWAANSALSCVSWSKAEGVWYWKPNDQTLPISVVRLITCVYVALENRVCAGASLLFLQDGHRFGN